VSGLGDEQEVVHVLQGLADTVAATVAALGLARVVWSLLRATLHLQTDHSIPKSVSKNLHGRKGAKRIAKTRLIIK